MKKILPIIIAVVILVVGVALFFVLSNSKEQLEEFAGITFENSTIDYDGESHTLVAEGYPADATVEYLNAGPFVDAGRYEIKVKISKKGYNDFEKTATLQINKIDFTGVIFEDLTVEYDGNAHEIIISGTLPATATIEYSSDVSGVKNVATETGEYNVTAYIREKNHNDLVLKAKLTITGTKEERFMVVTEDGKLFFQNAMDDNELYSYNDQTQTLEKVSGDTVSSIIKYENNGAIFVSKTLFISSIKTVVNDVTKNIFTTVYTGNANYVQYSGEIIYYVANGLTNEKSGIYKLDTSVQEPTPICLSVGKAKYLQLVGETLYFADGANDYKLSKINTTQVNQNRTIVVDEKINTLVANEGALYYVVNRILGNYIEKYVVASNVRRKLTSDAGESLTVVGNTLYYVNIDKLTSNFIGEGIYSIPTNPLADCNDIGSLIIEGGALGVCSLATDGENLYYYDVDGYKLMKYDISSKNTTNLLEGFVKPEDPAPISTGSKIEEYNGNIYYLDIWDEKTLHCYNPKTGLNYRLTTQKVVDFAIIEDTLYFNMVSYLVNNDTYKINLKTGGEALLVNTNSAYDFCSNGEYLYYVEENVVGAKTAIHKCKVDGSEDSIIYDKGAYNLRLVGNKLYFIDGNNIHCLNMENNTDNVISVDGRKIHTTVFDTDGTYLYYRDMYGVAYSSKRLARCYLDGSGDVKLVSEDIDPTEMSCIGDYVYFYTDTVLGFNGLYRVRANAPANSVPEEIVPSNYYARSFAILEGKLYFVNYKDQLLGDCHLYSIEIGESEPKLIQ